jgi:UPF0755 protein
MKKTDIKLLRLLLLSILILPFIVVFIINYFKLPSVEERANLVPILIPRGTSIEVIADSLQARGLIDDKEIFILWLKTLDKDRSIKAGYYEIPKNLTYAQLITFLSTATSREVKVTLLEGWRIPEIAAELQDRLQIDSVRFVHLACDSAYISTLGLTESSLEGYLLPDTYQFYWGVDEKQIIEFLVGECLSIFDEKVKTHLDSMRMTIHQVLTLASIIEGEAIYDDERPLISSVYHNRLKRRIKLQADPTIQYILAGPPRRLLYKDLEIDSPYNTYKYYGLPPGPISNPGKKSIMAAIYPEQTSYIYFVAKGDGRHTFSRNAVEHQQAKAEFDRVRREVYRKKRASNLKREVQ